MLLITPDETQIYMEDEYLLKLIKIMRDFDQDNTLHGILLAIYSEAEEYVISIKELNALFKAMYLESIGGF